MANTNTIKITIKEQQPVDYDYLSEIITALNDCFVGVEEIVVNDRVAFVNGEGFKDEYKFEGGDI